MSELAHLPLFKVSLTAMLKEELRIVEDREGTDRWLLINYTLDLKENINQLYKE